MRIAIPVENGEIYQHFGHAPAFRVYDVENSKVIQVQKCRPRDPDTLPWQGSSRTSTWEP